MTTVIVVPLGMPIPHPKTSDTTAQKRDSDLQAYVWATDASDILRSLLLETSDDVLTIEARRDISLARLQLAEVLRALRERMTQTSSGVPNARL